MNAKRTISLAALALMTTISYPYRMYFGQCEAVPQEGDFWTLSIVSTNDIHGYDDSLPQYATIIERARDTHKNLLVLEGGDIFLRGEFNDLKGIPRNGNAEPDGIRRTSSVTMISKSQMTTEQSQRETIKSTRSSQQQKLL